MKQTLGDSCNLTFEEYYTDLYNCKQILIIQTATKCTTVSL